MHFASTQIKTLLLGTLFHYPRVVGGLEEIAQTKQVGEAELHHIIYRFYYKHKSGFQGQINRIPILGGIGRLIKSFSGDSKIIACQPWEESQKLLHYQSPAVI